MTHTDPTADEPDTCRPVEIDGEIIRVRGAAEMSDESRAALAEVIAAAKRKFEVEHPQTEPTDPERRERYAAALYATLEVSPTRHPWETLSPIRRAVWYARADAAMTVADEEVRAAASAVVSPPPSRAAEELAKHVTRSIFALKTPSPDGSTHYQSGWDDGLEAAMDAARDAVLAVLPEQADRAAVPVCICGHPEERHFEDVCQTCGCGDYLEPRDAAEVIARWRQAALTARDELRRLAVEAHDTGTQQPEAHANGLPLVKGNCPACRHASLFLGTGGYPTCSNYECPEPDAATTVLEQYANEAHAPSHVWTIESPRRDNWASWGTTYDDRDWAAERYESALSTAPQRPFRLVRATTTYTVEAERQPPTPVVQQPKAEARPWHRTAGFDQHDDYREDVPAPVPPGCWYNAAAAEEAMREEPLDEPGPAAQQPAAADGEETLPPPEGPEYTPCVCDHIEPDHDINGRWCSRDGCECALYRPTPPASLHRSEGDCPGFPERCPNLRPVDPNPPVHLGGIRCGCADTP